jgi:hypothetical protein
MKLKQQEYVSDLYPINSVIEEFYSIFLYSEDLNRAL